MNRELMLQVADAVESERAHGVRIGLDMHSYHGKRSNLMTWLGLSCGTTACIGGFVDVLVSDEEDARWIARSRGDGFSVFGKAMEALDLGYREANELMYDFSMFDHINKNQRYVPDALRWMALTGKVDWIRGINAAKCVRNNA